MSKEHNISLPEEPLKAAKIDKGLRAGQYELHPKLFSEHNLKRLRYLGIRSAEEFIGTVTADSKTLAENLGVEDKALEELKTKTLKTLPEELQKKITEPVEKHVGGAIKPPVIE